MLWARDPRVKAGGYWRCVVKTRERNQRWSKANPDRERERKRQWCETNIERLREYKRQWWYRADGGYIRRRKRMLAQQRAKVLEQLAEVRRLVDQP